MKCQDKYQPTANYGDWVDDNVEHDTYILVDEHGTKYNICRFCKGKIYPKGAYA